MYTLKTIRGNRETVQFLGDFYEIEYGQVDTEIPEMVAKVHYYCTYNKLDVFNIYKKDEAYITTVDNKTVNTINKPYNIAS